MRVIHKDPRNGLIKIVPETLDDLWHLNHLVEPGDEVTAMTFRTAEEEPDKLRADKRKKERVTMTLKVERVEFAEFSDRLRILGTIMEGTHDLGDHHTFNVTSEGIDELTLRKPDGFGGHHWDRLNQAVAASGRPIVTILALDDEEATIAVLRAYAVQTLATLRGRTAGKQYESEDTRSEYFGVIFAALKRARAKGSPLIVVGPGFTREGFLKFVRERDAAFLEGCLTEGTANGGPVGVQEALRRGIVERIQREQQLAVDTRLVEEILAEIARDGPVAYGRDEVERALRAGAIKRLLVTDEILRTPDGERLLEASRLAKAESHVVAASHEAGKKLQGLGGLAALLRYRLPR